MSGKTGAKEVLIFLAGLAVAVLAVIMVLRGGGGDQPPVTSTDGVSATESATQDDQSAEPTAQPVAEPDETQQPAPEPAETTQPTPSASEPTQEDVEPPALSPDDSLGDVPDDPSDPRAIAAQYVTDSRTMDYRVGPNAWIEEADYLSDDLAKTLGAGTDLISAQWESDYEDRQFIQEVENVQVMLEDSGDPSVAMVFVQWNTYTMQRDSIDTRGSDQAILVVMDHIDGRWQVTGEGYPH